MKINELQNYTVVAPAKQRTATPIQPPSTDPFLQQVGTGAAKELGSTAIGLGTIGRGVQKVISKGADKLLGTSGFGLGKESVFDKDSATQEAAQEFLTPQGGAEKLGAFATEAATFMVPGSAATKATKGANFATRAATLGASDAGVVAVQDGGFDRDALDAAIIGAAFPVVGKAGSAAKSAVLPSGKDAGGRVINSLIKPLLKDFSYGKNPGQAVAEAGITANSLDELGQKITLARQSLGDEIAQKVSTSKTTFDARSALSPLDQAITEAQKSPRTNANIINRLQNLKADLLRVNEDGIPTRSLEKLNASEMFELKREIGDLTRWTGNATDDEIVNKALKQTYGGIKGQLDENIDGISILNEKYANLKSAEIATNYRDKIAARQNLVSFSGLQTGTAAGIVSAVMTGGAVAPILVAGGVAATTEALKSPAVKTRAAAWLASASKEEVKDTFTQAPWLRSALQAALFGEEEDMDSLTKND